MCPSSLLSADQPDSIADDIIIGVATTVIAAMILSSSAWAYRRFKIAKGDWTNGTGRANDVPIM